MRHRFTKFSSLRVYSIKFPSRLFFFPSEVVYLWPSSTLRKISFLVSTSFFISKDHLIVFRRHGIKQSCA
jgi:hypothetical protein